MPLLTRSGNRPCFSYGEMLRPLIFAKNSLDGHFRVNWNPVPDHVEDKHFQRVMDSRFRGNDREETFCKGLMFTLQKRGYNEIIVTP